MGVMGYGTVWDGVAICILKIPRLGIMLTCMYERILR